MCCGLLRDVPRLSEMEISSAEALGAKLLKEIEEESLESVSYLFFSFQYGARKFFDGDVFIFLYQCLEGSLIDNQINRFKISTSYN